jgi:hypothetical protein
MGHWNEEQIKNAIMKGRRDGICDKNGNTIKYYDGTVPTPEGRRKSDAGKGDRPRPVNKEKYDKNYERVFGTKLLNIWPRDKKGRLIGA